MSEVLAALVVWPVVAAMLPLLLSLGRRSSWAVVTAALSVQVALAVALGSLVIDRTRVTYVVGGVPPPFGIELVADGLSVPFVALVALVALGLMAYSRAGGPRSNPYHSLVLLLVAGLTGVVVTGDVFTLYVFLEISGLAAYALVAQSPGGAAAVAALRYLLVGTVGATFYLFGVGYAYIATGTLNMAGLAAALPSVGYSSTLAVAAFGLMVVGLAVKVALVPVHTWLPGAHSKAPVPVSVLLSGVVTSVAAYAVIRLILTVFSPAFFVAVPLADDALLIAAAASVLYGGYAAIRETEVKRVLAYSTVAQIGLAMLGVGLLESTALTGTLVHLLGHGVMKGGLFVAAGCLAVGYGATTVDDYAGLARRTPVVGGSFAIGALGMVGIPPTVGLLGKWYLALGALQTGTWLVAGLVLVSTLLSLAVFGPILYRLYFEPAAPTTAVGEVSLGMRAVATAAAVATLLLGFSGPYLSALLRPVLVGVG